MNPLTRLDSWLLKEVQKFSDWIYDMIGVTNFMIARILLATAAMSFILEGSLITYKTLSPFGMAILAFGYYITRKYWREYKLLEEGSNLFIEMILGFRRWVFLGILMFEICLEIFNDGNLFPTDPKVVIQPERQMLRHYMQILFFGWMTCLTASLYFVSCKKPPKKKSRAKEALEKLGESLMPKPVLTS